MTVPSQVVGLSASDKRDERGCEWQPSPIALDVPFSLSSKGVGDQLAWAFPKWQVESGKVEICLREVYPMQ